MLALYLHFFASFWMMTIIWFVQLVHYPLFLAVPLTSLVDYSIKHQRTISFLVMPAMLIELASLIYMGLFFAKTITWNILAICLAIIWLSTFLLQVPCHQQLIIKPTYKTVKRLIHTNWIRTIFWTLKTIIVIWVIQVHH